MDFSDCSCIEDIKLKQELLQSVSVIPNDKLQYHYTSPKGVDGILKNENIELRFTRIDCVNDTTDGSYIIEYYKNICKQLLENKNIDKDYFNSIINVLPFKEFPFIHKAIPPLIIDGVEYKECCISEYVTYIFCFSTLSDSLPMWNYYLKNGQYEGWNLGFSSLKLKEAFHYHPYKRNFLSELIVVEYDDHEKDDILKDFVQALYRYRHKDDTQLSKTKLAISCELFKWRCAFKSKNFSHEKEVRLAIHLPLNEDKTALSPFAKTELRYGSNAGIPKYIFVPLFDKMAICEITVSPLFNGKKQKRLLMQLTNKGYDVKVNHSKIPIRF
ncbi:DUF2971 domain-containing protein [Metallumcola ferriviriculae]|uniref:DUF2971 domain-containing protein n=1 Tax=Metallumcola ferriviriculae TaxID=3039180 RepID=A0AAU0UJQ7_9FIRM|nr:DUF2971 domain-containing protein [Desulfitibacteraceae bacterium MK1]